MAFFIINNLIWLSQDTLPPAWDQSGHMLLSLKYYKWINEIKSVGDLKSFFAISHYYPPFFYISALPVISLFGFSEHKLIFINFLYLIIFGISIFGIGKILFNERVGVFAAALTLFYPIMYALSREYLIDFSLVAMITCVQYLIFKSDGGIKKPWNIFLGIQVAFALLTKPTALIFFLPLWVYVFLKNAKNKDDFIAFLKSISISLIICLPWYYSAYKDLINSISYFNNVSTMIEHDPVEFIPSVMLYINMLKNNLISPKLLSFFILGFIFSICSRRMRGILFMLLLWALPAFFVLVFIPSKDPRYIMPILPVFSLITVAGIDCLKQKIVRNILFCLILVIGYLQFNNLSFNVPPFLIKEKSSYCNRVPLKQDWKIKEILDFVYNRVGNKHIVIGMFPDWQFFNPPEFLLYTELYKLPYRIAGQGYSELSLEQIKIYDFYIIKYPNVAPPEFAYYREKFYREFGEFGMENLGFNKLAEFILPDKSKASVYQKVNN